MGMAHYEQKPREVCSKEEEIFPFFFLITNCRNNWLGYGGYLAWLARISDEVAVAFVTLINTTCGQNIITEICQTPR